MRILITAGPTREPIDAVRYIGNRSSGKMGAALAEAAVRGGHEVTIIAGPVGVEFPKSARRMDVETAEQMSDAVAREFPNHDLLIMTAAVADFRPRRSVGGKMPREKSLTLELEATPDILAHVATLRRPDQRTVGFSLEAEGGLERAGRKLAAKKLDLIVFNSVETIDSAMIAATLIYADGRSENLGRLSKSEAANRIVDRATKLFPNKSV